VAAAVAVVEKVLGLYREKYFDLNVRHFHEKLQEEHQVEISYSWVKGILQGAGMVSKGASAGCIASCVRGDRCPGCVNDFVLESTETSTKVTWTMQGPNLYVMRIMGVFVNMDRTMGKHFETGLANLKAVAEQGPDR
jgi:hypothetical protein